MTRPLYVIVNWDLHFETYESKRLVKACTWVAMPNKHDGKSYRRLSRERDGLAIYGAWAVVVQVASKCPVRGVLADLDGPLNAEDLEDKTGFPEKGFERVLEFACSERIGWARKVEDEGEIAEILKDLRDGKTHAARRRSGDLRQGPQASADSTTSPQAPAGNGNSPADSGISPQSPQAPADFRAPPLKNADERASRARAGGPDITRPDRTGPHTTAAAAGCVPEGSAFSDSSATTDPKVETWHFILGLFGKKKNRAASYEAADALARQATAGALPLSADQWEILTWFYGLPADPKDIDLRGRFSDADRLAINLLASIDRAESYAKKIGREKKKGAAEPEGWREWFQGKYPKQPVPAAWLELPDYLRDDAKKELGVAA